ncbi:protein of unknown function [Pararobbsia alpina]
MFLAEISPTRRDCDSIHPILTSDSGNTRRVEVYLIDPIRVALTALSAARWGVHECNRYNIPSEKYV